MSSTTFRLPAGYSQISGSWTTPENIENETVNYASIAIAAKSTTYELAGTTFGFSTGVLPDDVHITQVNLRVRGYVSSSSNANFGVQPYLSSTAGTDHTASDTSATTHTYDITSERPGGGSWQPSDFRDGTLTVRCRAEQGNTSSSRTYYFDYVEVEVVYWTMLAQGLTVGSPSIGSPVMGVTAHYTLTADSINYPANEVTNSRFFGNGGGNSSGGTGLFPDHWYDYATPGNGVVLDMVGKGIDYTEPTNVFPNSKLLGGVVGNPGTLPDNTLIYAGNGISAEVISATDEKVQIRFYGTGTGAGASWQGLYFGREDFVLSADDIPAKSGQQWTAAFNVRLVAGTYNPYSTSTICIDEYDSSAGYLENGGSNATPTGTEQRFSHTRTLANAACAYIDFSLIFDTYTGVAYDFTLEFSKPQLEPGATATTYTPTPTSGREYIDIRVHGTPTAEDWPSLNPESAVCPSTAQYDYWSTSCYASLRAGSWTNVDFCGSWVGILNSSDAWLENIPSTGSWGQWYPADVPTCALTRVPYDYKTNPGQVSNAAAAKARPGFYVHVRAGLAVDITLRYMRPAMERGQVASAVPQPTPYLDIGRNAALNNIAFTVKGQKTDGTAITLELPDLLPGDVVYVGQTTAGNQALSIATSGYSAVTTQQNFNNVATNGNVIVHRKVMGAVPDTQVVTSVGANTYGHNAIAVVMRGIDQSTQEDATPTKAYGNSTNPNPAAIDTVTDGATVLVFSGSRVVDDAINAPTGYTLQANISSNSTYDSTLGVAGKLVPSSGTEDPAAWANWATATWGSITVAVRPLVPPVVLTANSLTVGSPEIGTPVFDLPHKVFTANPLTVGSPSIAQQELVQKHVFTGTALTVGSPTFGAPSLSISAVGLLAVDLTVQSPTFGTPKLIEVEVALGLDVGSPTFGQPEFFQHQVLKADNLTVQSPTFGTPIVTGGYTFPIVPLTVGSPTFGTPAFDVNYDYLEPSGLSVGSPTFGTPVLSIKVNLAADSLAVSAPVLDTPQFNVTYVLGAVDLTVGSPEIQSPPFGGVVFSAIDLVVGAPEIGPDPEITQVHALGTEGLITGPPDIGDPVYSNQLPNANDLVVGRPELPTPRLIPNYVHDRGLGAQLLYRAATGFEKSLADIEGERITAVPAELVRDIWDPAKCPTSLLPYLAWAMGCEYWNDNWSETTKRAWIASQWIFKNRRGTRSALKMAVDYAGRDVSWMGYSTDKITTRPQQVFSGPSLTKAEREAWLSRLPQVRVWRVQEQDNVSSYKAFYGASNSRRMHSRRFCIGGAYFVPSTALERLKRRARWVEHGVETDTKVSEFGSYWRIHKPGVEDSKVFSGRPFGLSRCFVPSDAWKRLITVQPKSSLPWRSPVTPTLQAVTSEAERVKVPGVRDHKVFCDVPMRSGAYYIPSAASLRIYEFYAVLDPSVRELRRPAVQFMGVGRYGFPPFTAWVDVKVNNRLNQWAAGFGFYQLRLKFWIPHDGNAVRQVRLAAMASKSLRDKILLRLGPKPRFVAGEKPILADIDTVIVGRP